MYLKSIEVHGFKSFANKMLLEFHNGITGIVGPNGSGKSNVADAVRWVLGEQRAKQLRGASMQDVIFSGTELRKPLSYASVAITLDNSDHQLAIDFDEVTVTRRVYRSGESEYLINGVSCRLKDINELFYDTGIGKEGYSIIGQGQIDKILSGKPEDRRELFDEAAGIVKFKKRKNSAQKQLEEERASLVRVNDIIGELEKQRGPLERQSETAKIYLQKKEELKVYDVNHFLLQTEENKALQIQIEEKRSLNDASLAKVNEAYDKAKEEYETLEKELDQLEETAVRTRKDAEEARMSRQKLMSRIDLLNEQINTVRMNDEHIKNRMAQVEQGAKERADELLRLKEEKNSIKQELDTKRNVKEEAEESLLHIKESIAKVTERIDVAKGDIIELLNNRASTKGKIQRYEAMREQVQIRKAQLSSRLIQLKSEEEIKKEERIALEQKIFEIKNQIKDSMDKSDELSKTEMQFGQKIHESNENADAVQLRYHKEKSRLDSVKNMTERYEGYGNSIRKVMDQKAKEPGIIGVVADLIKVDKQYETAIETALGGSIQNIVTKDENTAKRMIQLLKQTKAGRATFLPLTSVKRKNESKQDRISLEKGVIGYADTLVKTDSAYQELIAYLLGRTVVVEEIDSAILLARKYNYSLRIVTLEGESLSPGGSMTGGAFKNAGNLLARRREIEELERSVEKVLQELKEIRAHQEELRKERTAVREAIMQEKEYLQKKYLEQNTLEIAYEQLSEKEGSAADELQIIQAETNSIEEQFHEIDLNKEQIANELQSSEQKEHELEDLILQSQDELDALRGQEGEATVQAETIRLMYAQIEQKIEFIVHDENRIRAELNQLKSEQEQLTENLSLASHEIDAKQEEIAQIHLTLETSAKIIEEKERKVEELTKSKEQKNNRYKALFGEREQLSEEKARLDKEAYRYNAQYEKLEESIDQLINYMWEEYQLTWSLAKELKKDVGSASEIKKQIQSLKESIKKLGDVNVNAIEDYKELMERFVFLTGQRDDLEEAEASLMNIITELDEGMRRQFKEQFAAICTEFEKAFKELFGGGKATLRLTEGDDILEAGILIDAQPPGKKLQNMMQLSGGEKALTAISLLFAIQNLKPSPFCLLDEIEAALDDSNVGRFANYLHKLTKNTQFIIITHRRGTMGAADRLYGITMQEKGVSALVSVDLIENDLDK